MTSLSYFPYECIIVRVLRWRMYDKKRGTYNALEFVTLNSWEAERSVHPNKKKLWMHYV